MQHSLRTEKKPQLLARAYSEKFREVVKVLHCDRVKPSAAQRVKVERSVQRAIPLDARTLGRMRKREATNAETKGLYAAALVRSAS